MDDRRFDTVVRSSGICAPRGAVCPDGQCRSGYACPDGCYADDWRPDCQSGYCLYDGACA